MPISAAPHGLQTSLVRDNPSLAQLPDIPVIRRTPIAPGTRPTHRMTCTHSRMTVGRTLRALIPTGRTPSLNLPRGRGAKPQEDDMPTVQVSLPGLSLLSVGQIGIVRVMGLLTVRWVGDHLAVSVR